MRGRGVDVHADRVLALSPGHGQAPTPPLSLAGWRSNGLQGSSVLPFQTDGRFQVLPWAEEPWGWGALLPGRSNCQGVGGDWGARGGHPRECVQRSGHTYLWVGKSETLSHLEHPCPSPPCFRETSALGVGSVFDPQTESVSASDPQGAQRFRVDMPSGMGLQQGLTFPRPPVCPEFSLLSIFYFVSVALPQFEISGFIWRHFLEV